jgi:hypothetical protein
LNTKLFVQVGSGIIILDKDQDLGGDRVWPFRIENETTVSVLFNPTALMSFSLMAVVSFRPVELLSFSSYKSGFKNIGRKPAI